MALLGQLFTPEEIAGDLRLHELTPQERELILLAIAHELGRADQQFKDDVRARIQRVIALIRPGGTAQAPPTTP